MNQENLLGENSLYKNPTEKAVLMSSYEQIMSALVINFFGTLGLMKMSLRRAPLKNYPSAEKSLFPTKISDDNFDVSLVIKLALDASLISRQAADGMTKLLTLIKQQKIKKTADFDDVRIRDLMKTLHLSTNRPSSYVLSVAESFMNNSISLEQMSAQLYALAKKKEFKSLTGEFRDYVMRGLYTDLFKLLPPPGQHQNQPVAPAAPNPVIHKAVLPTVALTPAPSSPISAPPTAAQPKTTIAPVHVHTAPSDEFYKEFFSISEDSIRKADSMFDKFTKTFGGVSILKSQGSIR